MDGFLRHGTRDLAISHPAAQGPVPQIPQPVSTSTPFWKSTESGAVRLYREDVHPCAITLCFELLRPGRKKEKEVVPAVSPDSDVQDHAETECFWADARYCDA